MISAPDRTKLDRKTFFAKRFPNFWADVEGYPYALFDTVDKSTTFVDDLKSAAADAWNILRRLAPVLRALPDNDLRTIGIPETALQAVRIPHHEPSVVARFDFAQTADGGFKVLEVNAMTPFLLWESHEISGAVARELGQKDPNNDAEDILRTVIAEELGGLDGKRLVVTAFNTWREDWMTAQYLARVIRSAGYTVDVVPVSDLRMHNGFLVDSTRDCVDVLWSQYPLEHFALDKGGAALCNALVAGRLRLINPPSALLTQNKATLAIVWGLTQNGGFFNDSETSIVNKLFLESSMEPGIVAGKHVQKPVLGREGNSVTIVDDGAIVAAADHRTYATQPTLYQSYVDLPKLDIIDPKHGKRTLRAIYTAFVANGKPTSVCCRVGNEITDAWAQMLPIGIVT